MNTAATFARTAVENAKWCFVIVAFFIALAFTVVELYIFSGDVASFASETVDTRIDKTASYLEDY